MRNETVRKQNEKNGENRQMGKREKMRKTKGSQGELRKTQKNNTQGTLRDTKES